MRCIGVGILKCPIPNRLHRFFDVGFALTRF